MILIFDLDHFLSDLPELWHGFKNSVPTYYPRYEKGRGLEIQDILQTSRCLELCIKVMRKRLQRVGGTQNGKSELDSSSYAEFYQEHDGNLTLDVWWPNHE